MPVNPTPEAKPTQHHEGAEKQADSKAREGLARQGAHDPLLRTNAGIDSLEQERQRAVQRQYQQEHPQQGDKQPEHQHVGETMIHLKDEDRPAQVHHYEEAGEMYERKFGHMK